VPLDGILNRILKYKGSPRLNTVSGLSIYHQGKHAMLHTVLRNAIAHAVARHERDLRGYQRGEGKISNKQQLSR
jgi:hypothetical protein